MVGGPTMREDKIMIEKKVTRRSKLGWDFCCDASHYDTIGIPLPDKPYYVGTYNTVCKAIAKDKTYHSLQNTYHTTAWFCKHDGKWLRLVHDYYNAYCLNLLEVEKETTIQLES